MSTAGKLPGGAVTFEQLVALNDEMAALVRAGVPLERGLAELGRDLPGRSGRLAQVLAERMQAGESLPQILASDTETFPPVWRAVVEAGLRAGQLSAALESMSVTARRMTELRKSVGSALVYPLVVLAMAYGMFVCVVTYYAPITSRAYEDMVGTSDPWLVDLAWVGQTAVWWAAALPLVIAVTIGFWWRRSGRAAWSPRRRGTIGWPGRWLSPGLAMASVLYDERIAGFVEILSLLIRQRVPLVQAVVLAADAGGDPRIRRASQEIASRLERGEVLTRREDLPPEFPPLLGWLLVAGLAAPELGQALSRTAAAYRERAARTAQWTSVYLPIGLTVLVGGSAVLAQAVITLVPVWHMLYDLARTFT